MENIDIAETFNSGVNEHREAAADLAKASLNLSTTSAFFLNQGYGQCAIIGEIKAYAQGNGVYNVFLKDQNAIRKGWSKCSQRPIQTRSWRNIGNLMKILTCHQIVAPGEFCRKYTVLIQEGYNGNLPGYRQVVMSFWFSFACTSLLKKVTDDGKKTEYLEIVIDTEIHKKLTNGWRPSQNPRYVIYDVGLRVIGNMDKKNLDLK